MREYRILRSTLTIVFNYSIESLFFKYKKKHILNVSIEKLKNQTVVAIVLEQYNCIQYMRLKCSTHIASLPLSLSHSFSRICYI